MILYSFSALINIYDSHIKLKKLNDFYLNL